MIVGSKHVSRGSVLEGKTCLYNHNGGVKALLCYVNGQVNNSSGGTMPPVDMWLVKCMALSKDKIAQKRTILPLPVCQTPLHNSHVYRYVQVANIENTLQNEATTYNYEGTRF